MDTNIFYNPNVLKAEEEIMVGTVPMTRLKMEGDLPQEQAYREAMEDKVGRMVSEAIKEATGRQVEVPEAFQQAVSTNRSLPMEPKRAKRMEEEVINLPEVQNLIQAVINNLRATKQELKIRTQKTEKMDRETLTELAEVDLHTFLQTLQQTPTTLN
jgi:hypothetical protein